MTALPYRIIHTRLKAHTTPFRAILNNRKDLTSWLTPIPHCSITFYFQPKIDIHGSPSDVEERIWRFLGGIARKHKMTALQVGGVEDHIHALITAPPTIAPCKIAQFLKGDSSLRIHKEFSSMRKFGWQDGYAAFTVSKSNIPKVIRYIQNQREHHRKKTFQEEYLEFIKANGIQYDGRYLWD